jgi:hypothetical protein
MYEERVILVRAENLDHAIEKAETEAKQHCSYLEACEYVGYVHAFEIDAEQISEGVEVFSSMTRSDMDLTEYLDQYYPEDPDDCEEIGEDHRWHNVDDKSSACYHCKVTKTN